MLGREEGKKGAEKTDQNAPCLSPSAFSWKTLVREFPGRGMSYSKQEHLRNWSQIVTGLELGQMH